MRGSSEMEGFELVVELTSIEGIGENTAEKLISAGIPNAVALATSTVPKLVVIGLTKTTARKLIQAAQAQCEALFGFTDGTTLLEQCHQRAYLTSGIAGLDRLLGGKGFETQRVYEIYGPEGTGKSTVLQQLLCTATLPETKGGLGAQSAYIDTEGTFSLKRVERIAERFDIPTETIRGAVLKASPPTTDFLLYLCEVSLMRQAVEHNIRLICMDSLATLFRVEYGEERSLVHERNQRVARVLQALKRVARAMNGVVVLSNQIAENLTYFGRPWWHWGYPWQQDSQVRIQVRFKSIANAMFRYTLEKSIDLPPNECLVKLGAQGVEDYVEKRQKSAPPEKFEPEYYGFEDYKS